MVAWVERIKISEDAKTEVLNYLRKNGASRPFQVGLACMPKNNKPTHYRQWANRQLLRLQLNDLVTSFKNESGEVFYRVKDGA